MPKTRPLSNNLLLKFRGKDSSYGVTRETLKALAEELLSQPVLSKSLTMDLRRLRGSSR